MIALIDAAMYALSQSDGPERDVAIVLTCVKLTIALLTAGLVWFFAMRLARWLVPLGVAAKLAIIGFGAIRSGMSALVVVSPLYYLSTLLGVAAAALLFTTSAREWFLATGAAGDAFA